MMVGTASADGTRADNAMAVEISARPGPPGKMLHESRNRAEGTFHTFAAVHQSVLAHFERLHTFTSVELNSSVWYCVKSIACPRVALVIETCGVRERCRRCGWKPFC